MEILSIIWQFTQTLVLAAVIISSVILLIALFHPLRFDVKLRGSVKGQRAEVWFVYLFRLFKVGVIATPHTQDLVVSFMGWKKRLNRAGRKKPVSPAPPTGPSAAQPPTDTSTPTTAPSTAESSASKAEPDTEKAVKPEIQPEPDIQPVMAAKDEEAPASVPEKAADVAVEQHPEAADASSAEEPETIEPVHIDTDTAKAGVDSRPLKPLHEVEAEYKAAKDSKPAEADAQPGAGSNSSAGKTTGSFKHMLRKFKRDASRRFNQFKAYARLFRLKWRSLSPVVIRFWQRGRRGFGLPRIDLLLRYALHEPYLTGMCHGTLAVASGMAGQWGVNFVPVPQFGAPMLYSRAYVTAVVRPWRLAYATGALLFEKQLYKEAWQLFKWYRAKKQH